MDIRLKSALSTEDRPHLDSRFAQQVSSRTSKTKQVRPSIRVLLTIYWISVAFATIAEVTRIPWPGWLVSAAAVVLIPATVAFMTRH
jgi:hypothetical protein